MIILALTKLEELEEHHTGAQVAVVEPEDITMVQEVASRQDQVVEVEQIMKVGRLQLLELL